MTRDLALRCRCGRVRGVARNVSPRSTQRAVCYCDDCQAFARWLGVPGILDAAGATEVLQLPPARVRLLEGADALRSLRLAPGGLLRWYTDCCRTPVANTVSARLPFVGLIHPFLDLEDERAREEVLGPVQVRVHGRFAVGPVPADTHPKVPLAFLALSARRLMGWLLAREGRPSPFFDPRSGAPVVAPIVLSPAERAGLRATPECRAP